VRLAFEVQDAQAAVDASCAAGARLVHRRCGRCGATATRAWPLRTGCS
jgi:hypothetical protein